jgi:ubiquinone/menaquinone biosynthesis C-methylase UbiE
MIPFRTVLFFSYSRVIDPLLRSIRTSSAEFAGMKAGDRVLDVCCGTGDQVLHYAGRQIIATGADLKHKRRLGLDNVSLQMADARRLPFKDNMFDHVSISMGLHEKEREARSRIIAEMKRVVKAGGFLLFVDYQVPLPRNMVSLMIKTVERAAGREHFSCFQDYMKQGGLDEILNMNGLQQEKTALLLKGAVAMVKCPL